MSTFQPSLEASFLENDLDAQNNPNHPGEGVFAVPPDIPVENNGVTAKKIDIFKEYWILMVFLIIMGILPPKRVSQYLNHLSFRVNTSKSKIPIMITCILYSIYSLTCFLWTLFPLTGFIYFLIVKLSIGLDEDPRAYGVPGWSEMSGLPIIQIPVGMLLTTISPCMFIYLFIYFHTQHFENQFSDMDSKIPDNELVNQNKSSHSKHNNLQRKLKSSFRNYLILFCLVYPIFLVAALICVHITRSYFQFIIPYYSTTWIVFDVILHVIAFSYALAHIYIACAIFCLVQDVIRLRIEEFKFWLKFWNANIRDIYLDLMNGVIKIEEKVIQSSERFQFMFSTITSLSFLAILVSMISLFQNPIQEVWLGFFFGTIFLAPSFFMTFVAGKISDETKGMASDLCNRTIYTTIEPSKIMESTFLDKDSFCHSDDLFNNVKSSNDRILRSSLENFFMLRVMNNRCGFKLFGILLTGRLVFQLSASFISFVAFAVQRTINFNFT